MTQSLAPTNTSSLIWIERRNEARGTPRMSGIATKVWQDGGVALCVPEQWEDISSELTAGSPFTLVDREFGVGALQVSPAVYRAGPHPTIGLGELLGMLDEFAISRDLETRFDDSRIPGPVSSVAASFRSGSDFVRVWYSSDGRNVALTTYVCDWDEQLKECGAVEAAVQSLRFVG